MDGITPVEDEPGRHGHGERGKSTDTASHQRFKFQRQPDATNTHEHNRQTQRPQVSAQQLLGKQEHVKMDRPVVVRRIVAIKAVLDDLVDEPAIYPFVKVRRFDRE